MAGACSTHGRNEKCMQYFSYKTGREETNRGRPRHRWEDNIRMDLREIVLEDVE